MAFIRMETMEPPRKSSDAGIANANGGTGTGEWEILGTGTRSEKLTPRQRFPYFLRHVLLHRPPELEQLQVGGNFDA